jgi:phosphoribosylformylglycinamidine cyclo-ligase
MKKASKLTYKKAGVDIAKGERLVNAINPIVKKTFRKEVLSDIGSFGALFRLDNRKYRKPVLVSGTDGVGTKLKVAFMADRHDTVGIDLVAMCVNDILTSGAEPLFFLDYFATGKLDTRRASDVIKGIAEGCLLAGCALIGGETAEMPGFYRDGEYDLSGFAVGAVERDSIIDGRKIRAGDAVIGLASNGLHSNGFSLVRKIFFEKKRMTIDTVIDELGRPLGEELLKPTKIYVRAFSALRRKFVITGMAHITGGGLLGNLSRIIPKGLRAEIDITSWPVQPIFDVIREMGDVPDTDMRRTFNMGIGYTIVVNDRDKDRAVSILEKIGFESYIIGSVRKISGFRK